MSRDDLATDDALDSETSYCMLIVTSAWRLMRDFVVPRYRQRLVRSRHEAMRASTLLTLAELAWLYSIIESALSS